MADIVVAHTSALPQATLAAARALLDAVFEGQMTDNDWEHSLGGIHALVWDDGELIGHGSVVMRRLVNAGRALRTGYVEGVGVRADRRREGHGATLMTELEHVIENAYDIGALGSTDVAAPFYAARGWVQWKGPTSAITPDGVKPTPGDDGGVYVFAHGSLEITSELSADWRDGDVW